MKSKDVFRVKEFEWHYVDQGGTVLIKRPCMGAFFMKRRVNYGLYRRITMARIN